MRLSRAVLCLCLLLPLSVKAATVSVAGATFKVRRGQAPLAARSVAIAAARNEFEPFQLLVTGPATGVTATATSLSNGAATIGPVRLYREDLIRIVTQSAPDAIVPAGESLPDALVPDVDELYGEKRNAFVGFNVASGETRAIWGEVRVPETAAPGTYTGSVTVRFAEGSATIPVSLTVHDFALPTKPSLKSAFGLYYGAIPSGHGIAWSGAAFPALREKYGALALDHRVSLSHHDDGDGSIAHFDATYGPLVAGTAATQTPKAALSSLEVTTGSTDTAGLKSWYDHFAAQGLGDRLFQYTCDEPPQTCAWTDIPLRQRAAKAANPAYRTLVTSSLAEIRDAEAQYGISIVKDLEIVTPVINYLYDKPGLRFAGPQWQSYASFVASGPRKELWSYQSCMSHGCGGTSSYFTGWPSYTIDASAVRNRAMQWLEFLYRVTGELYFDTAFAYSHDPWSNQWDFHGNGDGTLFYPGTPARIGGTTHVPVASIRLKMIREGMEDFEYLKLLADLGDRAMAEREVQALFPTAYQTDADPAALMAARDRIARRIVELRGGVVATGPVPTHEAPFTPGVTVNGDVSEFTAQRIALSGAALGADVAADVRLAYDDDFLYASWAVKDAAIVVNQGGRDGEVWNGDSVELFLDVANDKAAALDPSHFHFLVNANGDLTDERGNAGAWDRGFTSGAIASAVRTSTGYAVELKVPWSGLGVAPCAGLVLGLDVAVNDVDQAGTMPKQVDWANLQRFAQPNRWNALRLSPAVSGGTYIVHRASMPMAIDGNLSEFARAPFVSLDAGAAAAGSENATSARLLHDATYLYVGFKVKDALLRMNQGGRDGEVWNGDGVELLLDLLSTRTAAPDADDRHLLVNAAGDLTDEAGSAGGWLRGWTSNAAVAVAGAPGSYTVEMAIPWATLGIAAPAPGGEIGLDLANNDLDADGVLRQFDWARLARFHQPALW
ncbi:MAG: sugar-binding protein, partial [Anaeromyxobacteraceae bacterium]